MEADIPVPSRGPKTARYEASEEAALVAAVMEAEDEAALVEATAKAERKYAAKTLKKSKATFEKALVKATKDAEKKYASDKRKGKKYVKPDEDPVVVINKGLKKCGIKKMLLYKI